MLIIRLLITLLILFITILTLLGQDRQNNIIINPGFEKYENCPNNFLSRKKFLPYWYSPTKGTPDYFNRCSHYKAGVPINFGGIMEPQSGNGYVGIVLVHNPNIIWMKHSYLREYIATQIERPLQKDQLYCIKFYISLADYSKYIVDEIGVYFSKKKVNKRTNLNLPYNPQVLFSGNMIDNDDKWIALCSIYKAMGGEQFIAIGNFQEQIKVRWIEKDLSEINKFLVMDHAYYYIDEVSLMSVLSESECICNEADKETVKLQEENNFENIEEGQTIVLKNIFFEFDKSELLSESYPALNMLYNILQENSLMEIEIIGHTDNIGTQQYNLELSLKRAESVANYLVDKGISKNRLSFKGYGNLYPASENNTEQVMALNRRVEIIIKKK